MSRLAIYPGSFNPFHKGHLDVLLKAEKIFDEVIIARGVNPEKIGTRYPMPQSLGDRQIKNYNGLLTDFLKGLPYDNVTVIRGLRNATDLQYEMNQYRYIQVLMPEIQMISIFCDKEYEHLSSSGIRALSGYGEEHVKDYLLY